MEADTSVNENRWFWDNGVSPVRHPAIIGTNGLFLTGLLEKYFSEMWIKTQQLVIQENEF